MKTLNEEINRIKNIIDSDYLDAKFEDISVNLFQKEEENNLYTGIQKLIKQNIKKAILKTNHSNYKHL